MYLRLPRVIAELFERWLRSPSGRSGVMDLGVYTPSLRMRYQGLHPSESLGISGRGWQRQRTPLYGAPHFTIPSKRILVPRGLRFRYRNEKDLPIYTPSVSLRAPRSLRKYRALGVPVPSRELIIRRPNYRRPEGNRRRKDNKPGGLASGYRRLLALISLTYGNYTEFMELVHAYQNNQYDPAGFATAVAINEGVDIAYGTRARFLRDHLYNSGVWPFPVGYQLLSRLWR